MSKTSVQDRLISFINKFFPVEIKKYALNEIVEKDLELIKCERCSRRLPSGLMFAIDGDNYCDDCTVEILIEVISYLIPDKVDQLNLPKKRTDYD